MSRKLLVEMTRRHIAHARAGTVDQAPGIHRVPARNYYDPDRGQREREQIFRRLPLLVGFSAELRDNFSYRALEVAGFPVLITRNGEGRIGAFANTCSHRGAQVVAEGTGQARRFACPYHAWTYDSEGALVGVLDSDEFGEVDRGGMGLPPGLM